MTSGKLPVDIPNQHLKMEPLLNGKPTGGDSYVNDSIKCNPKKRLVNLRIFVLVSGAVMCAQFALSIYTKSVLTSIERIFVISSSLAGVIVGAFNFGNMVFVVLVSKLSTNGHRPRIMVAGSLLVALGGFTNVIPHFASPNYNATLLNTFQTLSNNTQSDIVNVETLFQCSSSNLYIILIFGEMIQGIGATVLVPLASSYIDDFAQKGSSPLYLGVMFLLQNLGPGIGYLVGSLTTMLYVDFERVDQDQIHVQMTDKSWVGAWWLGYIILGAWVVITAIPLVWFPKAMDKENDAEDIEQNKQELAYQKGTTSLPQTNGITGENHIHQPTPTKENGRTIFIPQTNGICTKSKDGEMIAMVEISNPRKPGIIKDLLLTLKRLTTNPLYMLVVMGYAGLMFVVGALTAFMPKFLEVVFYQTKTQASLIFGFSMPIVICLGLFSGGFLVKRFQWSITNTMRFIVCASTLGILVCIPPLFVTCDPEDNITCTNLSNGTSDCVNDRGSMCKSQCYLFVILMSIAALVCCQIITPSYSIILRTVNKEDKCTAVGLKFLIIRMMAFIPSPVITGAIIDDTCIDWSKSEDCIGSTTCLIHDREYFRKSYLCIILIGVVVTCLFSVAGYAVHRRRKRSLNKSIQSDIL